jgi:predicted transport protein
LIASLDPAIEESPKKFYIAYRISQNIACMELQRQRVSYLKLDPKKVTGPPKISRDVTEIAHYGTAASAVFKSDLHAYRINSASHPSLAATRSTSVPRVAAVPPLLFFRIWPQLKSANRDFTWLQYRCTEERCSVG